MSRSLRQYVRPSEQSALLEQLTDFNHWFVEVILPVLHAPLSLAATPATHLSPVQACTWAQLYYDFPLYTPGILETNRQITISKF